MGGPPHSPPPSPPPPHQTALTSRTRTGRASARATSSPFPRPTPPCRPRFTLHQAQSVKAPNPPPHPPHPPHPITRSTNSMTSLRLSASRKSSQIPLSYPNDNADPPPQRKAMPTKYPPSARQESLLHYHRYPPRLTPHKKYNLSPIKQPLKSPSLLP